ncbi:DNA-binding protein [Paraburkholderia sacchari]|uniref:Mucin-associated surface protein n=1 Tax=Paraburkholderia sacchari TaxID=159450 RepID=A0A8T6ZN90_9BURK|nr:DNA-binding protein [Paraburkholderia sacchari]NLP65534.1 mucin-associated surface protein [Paraburkholderia sacchari]
MAREPSISQDQVSRVAEAIRLEGKKPTAREVRDRLGTGSFSTILKLMKAWDDSQVKPAEPPVVLPQGLQRGLVEFVASEVERTRAELRAEIDLANQANEDLIRECERLAMTVENLTASLEAVHAEKAGLSGQLREVEGERDAARQDASAERQAAESARTELAKALLRLEAMPRLEKELDELRQELAREHDARTDAQQSSAVALAKLEGAQAAQAAAEEALTHANAELTSVRQELKDTRTEASTELANLRAENATVQADLLAAVRPKTRRPLKAQALKKT